MKSEVRTQLQIEGISREALEEIYAINLVQNLMLEAKLKRIESELAVGSCAIQDGNATIKQATNGMLNLIVYIQSKMYPELELDPSKGSIDLVKAHLKKIEDFLKFSNNPEPNP